ncbi:MAG: translation initiation factor IF-2 [bacterium]|nr:translation initiation factor IF-2 [bacterium]
MNVTEIVRELKMTKDEFFPLAKELGFDIGERAIKVDDMIAVKLIAAIKKNHKQSKKKSLFEHEKEVEEIVEEGPPTEKEILEVTNPITTKQFADLMEKSVTEVIAVLVQNGIMATINQNLDFETVTIIAEDMGYKTVLVDDSNDKTVEKEREEQLETALSKDTKSQLENRPPIVVVMGHVDHGKTKLLDALRQTDIVAEEAGGITQSIGAYQITHKDRTVTFIDTPGHEAFTAMRSRGANVADLAILVIAADDGVKPQTMEAIEILEKAKLPFIVAINKIDKPDADIDNVKKGLSELSLIPEDWGGTTICVPVSAKAKQNIDELLEMVLLVADMNKDTIQANPNRDAVGTIIESKIDKDTGAVATVLIQTGTLRVGDIVQTGDVNGKIKALKTWKGEKVTAAAPSMPVEFLGLKGAPVVGDILTVIDKKDLKKQKKSYQSFGYLKDATAQVESNKTKLKVILKADTLGSLEAVTESLKKINYEEVEVEIIKSGLGNFTEKDIDQAVAAKAKLIGFNVNMSPVAADYALGTQTKEQSFSIIYKLIEHIEEQLGDLLEPEIVYNKIGEIKVLAIFKRTAKTTIVGGRVQSGLIKNKAIAKVVRNEKIIGEATVSQLRVGPKNVSEVTSGSECGISIDTAVEAEIDDIIEIYQSEEKKRILK